MSTVEVRVHTVERLAEALAEPVDAIGLGQEGCLTKLPDADTLRAAADRIRATGRTAVVVAPVAWPRTADQVADRMAAVAADGPTEIVVNDLGTALALAGAGARLVAGLALTRAQPHCGTVDGSPPGPVVDAVLFDQLAQWNLVAVELDTDTAPPPPEHRWQARQYVSAVPVAYGRSCPTARRHHSGPPDCRSLCDTPTRIDTHQRWQLNHGHREALPAGVRAPALTVWGNAVYRDASHPPSVGYRIIDARWYPGELLSRAVARARDAGTVSTAV